MTKRCPFKDDNGVRCSNIMSKKEEKEDGMCSRCANLLWSNFAVPLMLDKIPGSPIFHVSNRTSKKNRQ